VIYESSRLKFTCSDTGIGIPTNKLGTLFKEFSKIEESNNFNLQGVGLGLVISNQLVKALGGEGILVNSEFGVGSSFIFEVSAEESYNSACDIANEGINISVPSLLAKTMHRKIEVLIVDDVYFNIIALLEMFKQTGIICKYAMNGEEAIEKVMKNNFSCILMDCEMPIMDGWQTSKKLKTLQQEKAILNLPPILACTAYQSEIIKAKCFDHGMCDVIQKPCPREMIFERVHYWILFYLNHL
jgi:CheY-like chemotaxis protein